MSDQDTRFLPFFLREPVYVVPEPEPVAKEVPRTTLAYQGEGKRQVLVLVREPSYPFLGPDDQAFLTRVLSAVSLSADDILLVNWESTSISRHQDAPMEELLPTFPYQMCVVFGEVPNPWSLANFFEKYRVTEAQGKHLLQADDLVTLSDQVEKKARFWKCLQQLFGLS